MTSLVGEDRPMGVVNLNFTKAFSAVSCNILADKLMKCGLDMWTLRWAEKSQNCWFRWLWLAGWSPAGSQSAYVFHKQLILMSIPFKILINDLDNGSEYILSKFTGGTNLGVTGRLKGYAAIQREFDGMENVLAGILWGSIKANEKPCIYGKTTQCSNTGWGLTNSAEKDPGVLVGTKLTTSQQCAFAAQKASSILSYLYKNIAIRLRKWSFPAAQSCWDASWSGESSAELPSTREMWTYWTESSTGAQRWFMEWSVWHMRGCSPWKRGSLQRSY